MTKLVRGVGVNNITCKVGNKHDREYLLWVGILHRCYAKDNRPKNRSYVDCSISEEWKDYSKFKSDIAEMYGFGKKGWHLDKDILVKGNRVYSKETCCFVPARVNVFFGFRKPVSKTKSIGVYRVNGDWKRPFKASIGEGGKRVHLGYFDTLKEAESVYWSYKKKQLLLLCEEYRDDLSEVVYSKLINWEFTQ